MNKFYPILPAFILSAGLLAFISFPVTPVIEKISTKEIHKGSDGFTAGNERLDYEFLRLRDPLTNRIPYNIRRLELEYASTLPGFTAGGKGPAAKTEALTWNPRGPWNVGGRTRAFAIDVTNPNKFLAGSTSGGMWMSLDAGTTWTQVWTDVHQSVSCIAQDTRPGKTNTWYIGTGEGYGQSASGGGAYYLGNGMYKSTDGGLTWAVISSTSSGTPQTFENVFDIIWNVAANPADTVNDVVYVCTYGIVYKSTNGGSTWTIARGSTTTYSYFTDVAVSPTGVIYATLSSDGGQKGIWRSPDGSSWTNITPSGFPATYGRIKIGISPSDEDQVYFWAGVTTNFGTPDTNFMGQVEWNSLWKYHHDATTPQWYDLSANLPTTGGVNDKQNVQGGYDMLIKFHPTDTAVVFLGGTNLYRSDDGFFTPNNTTMIGGYKKGSAPPNSNKYLNHHPDQHEVVFDMTNNILYNSNDGGIYKTTNYLSDTVVWTPLNNGYLTSMFYTVALDHASPGDSTLIGGLQDNNSWFVNSNNVQTPWADIFFGDGSYCAIANNKLNYYFSIQNGKMQKMQLDASGNVLARRRIDPIGGKGYLFINPYVLDPNNNNRIYLAGGKNLWRNDSLNIIPLQNPTLPGGWDSISTGWTLFPDTLPIPWWPVNGILTGARISAVAVSKNPANIVYYGTTNKRVYRLDNAGTGTPAAKDITGAAFPAGNISCIAVDPLDAGNVMVAFSNYSVYSIFYSSNADSSVVTWTKVAGNLEQNSNSGGTGNGPSVRWVSIMPVSDGTVYLAATSTGLYATSNLTGTSTLWAQQGASTIGNSICDMIDLRTTDGLVAVATHSRGVFAANITSVNDVVSVNGLPDLSLLSLSNYPNPFTGSTRIRFTLPKPEKISLKVFDINGNLIQSLPDQACPSGEHSIEFSGKGLSSGIYYCHLQAGEWSAVRKMILLK